MNTNRQNLTSNSQLAPKNLPVMDPPPMENMTLQQKTPPSSLRLEKDEVGLYSPPRGWEEKFMTYVANLSLEKKKALVVSPEILHIILTPKIISAVPAEDMVRLAELVNICNKDDPIDQIGSEFPIGRSIAVGNHEMLVRMTENQIAQFGRGKVLEGVTIRACLASQTDPIPSNILIVDHMNLVMETPVTVPRPVDT